MSKNFYHEPKVRAILDAKAAEDERQQAPGPFKIEFLQETSDAQSVCWYLFPQNARTVDQAKRHVTQAIIADAKRKGATGFQILSLGGDVRWLEKFDA